MPELFSPDFLHQLSSLLPHLFYRCCRARKSERKSTEQGGEKKKENKRKQFSEGGGGGEAKERHNSSLISAPSSHSPSQGGSAGPVVLNAFAIFFNRVTFFSPTTGACLTGVGKVATWPKCTLASCKILARE